MSYFDSFVARLPPNASFNQSLFQTLLLAVVGFEKNVIIRAPEHDVARAAKSTMTILNLLLGLSVVKLNLRSLDALGPDEFLHLLFANTPTLSSNNSDGPGPSNSNLTLESRRPISSRTNTSPNHAIGGGSSKESSSVGNNGSGNGIARLSANSSNNKRLGSQSTGRGPTRFTGSPSTNGMDDLQSEQASADLTNAMSVSKLKEIGVGPEPNSNSNSSTIKSDINIANASSASNTPPIPPVAPIASVSANAIDTNTSSRTQSASHLERVPRRRLDSALKKPSAVIKDSSGLPQVLVISGLETASYAVQESLLNALYQRVIVPKEGNHATESNGSNGTTTTAVEKDKGKTVGDVKLQNGNNGRKVYGLPSGFFVVCICPTSTRDLSERPRGIDKSLLDRFSISAYLSPGEVSGIVSDSDPNITGSTSPGSLMTPEELQHLRTLALAHDSASVSYPNPVAPVRESGNHTRAHTGIPIHAHAHIHHKLLLYLADLFTATRHHPHLDGTLLTLAAKEECEALVRAWRVLFRPMPTISAGDRTVRYEVSDEDVRNVFHRVAAHRLRVLDGPMEEVKGSLLLDLSEPESRISMAQQQRQQLGGENASSQAGTNDYSSGSKDGKTQLAWTSGRRTVPGILREILEVV